MEALLDEYSALADKETKLLMEINEAKKDIAGHSVQRDNYSASISAAKTTAEKQTAQTNFNKAKQQVDTATEKLAALETSYIETMRRKNSVATRIASAPTPTPPPPHNPTPAGPSPSSSGVQGGQLAAITAFDGSPTVDAEQWIKMIDRFKTNFNWTTEQTAQTVRNKLTGEAALFVDNQEEEGIEGTGVWDTDGKKNLRTMLLKKFAPYLSAATASHAIDDLKQGGTESVGTFYERVRQAVTKFLTGHPRKTQPEKTAYSRTYGRLVFNFFKVGMYDQYRTRIFSGTEANHPKTHDDLMEAARGIELEAGKSKRDHLPKKAAAIAKPGDEPESEAEETPSEESDVIADLTKRLEAIEGRRNNWRGNRRGRGGGGQRGGGQRGGFRGRGRGQGNNRGGGGGANKRNQNCILCQQPGHWVSDCPYNALKNPGAFRGPPRAPPPFWQRNVPRMQEMQSGEAGAEGYPAVDYHPHQEQLN